jgi:hypothetical protein
LYQIQKEEDSRLYSYEKFGDLYADGAIFSEKLELLIAETTEKLYFSKEKVDEEEKIWESFII